MNDTIAAQATAPGEGGVAILRISGENSVPILLQLFRPAGRKTVMPPPSHLMVYGHIMDGEEIIDECMAVLMRAPRSYTREDVVEFQVHGGSSVAQRVLALCLREGARLAEPGEFTRRAFLNGRIDLSQAEAVMQLIEARGESARREAMRQLSGGTASFIRTCADQLYAIQAGLAACIDYPEEISENEAIPAMEADIQRLIQTLLDACQEKAARMIREGLHVVLCGRPNVGKSSLFNALLGEEKAIVTQIPGTTRDRVEGTMHLDGCLISLTDTAGLRDTDDPVESIGVSRARKALMEADLRLMVIDSSMPLSEEDHALLHDLPAENTLLLLNKQDLPAVTDISILQTVLPGAEILAISALTPETLAPLKAKLLAKARVTDHLALTLPRHLDAARRAAQALQNALDTLHSTSLDMCTLDLDAAQSALAEITGDQVEESLLDRVFSTFCVGK